MVLISPRRRTPSEVASIAMVTADLFAVLRAEETLGYVHKVGNVYVSLRGADFNYAVEIEQSLSWDRAVAAIDNN
jgi:hypothetical protein